MAYREFTLASVEQKLGVVVSRSALFNQLQPVSPPDWLQDTLVKGRPLAFVSEKSRSEFIVAPILLVLREMMGDRISIYSGGRRLAILEVAKRKRRIGR